MSEPTPCPRCGNEYTTRVITRGVIERTAKVFYLFPFRCKLCGARFTAFKFGVKYVRHEVDRRQFQRVAVDFPIGISVDDRAYEARSVDISIGGCGLRTDAPVDVGGVVTISLQILDKEAPIWVDAAVVRSIKDGEFGVEFLKMGSMEKVNLARFIEQQQILADSAERLAGNNEALAG